RRGGRGARGRQPGLAAARGPRRQAAHGASVLRLLARARLRHHRGCVLHARAAELPGRVAPRLLLRGLLRERDPLARARRARTRADVRSHVRARPCGSARGLRRRTLVPGAWQQPADRRRGFRLGRTREGDALGSRPGRRRRDLAVEHDGSARAAAPGRCLLRARARRRGWCRGRAPGDRPIERIARIAIRVALAAAILGFVPGVLEPFQPVKMLLLRCIGSGLLVWVALEAWAGRAPRSGGMSAAVLAWAGAAALATLFSISPRLSLLGEIDQREGLLAVLALAGLHLATRQSHRSVSDVRETLRVVVGCAVAAALYAQLQLAGP